MTKVWFDDDMIELEIVVSDGTSVFSNKVYVGYQKMTEVVSHLDLFREQVYGGLLDIQLGAFGPEYASGAFHAHLHFPRPGNLYISCKLESEFKEFSIKKVASEAKLYLKTEPVLLDNFISELKSLNNKRREDAHLEAI
ncbi:MAG: hypothetical protein WDN00_11085 [Limisphaerales bacterium]